MNRTKEFIINTFWNILEERPYNKITVQNIVDACHVNRNTFYYHFQDIPTLTLDSIQEWTDEVIRSQEDFGSPEKCMFYMAQECTKRKKALLHLYQSKHKDTFLRALNKIGYHVTEKYMRANSDKLALPNIEPEFILRYYKCTFAGIILDWLDESAGYDLAEFCEKISGLLYGSK